MGDKVDKKKLQALEKKYLGINEKGEKTGSKVKVKFRCPHCRESREDVAESIMTRKNKRNHRIMAIAVAKCNKCEGNTYRILGAVD